MGDVIVPFNLNTDGEVVSVSIDLASCEIKPEGHYILMKHSLLLKFYLRWSRRNSPQQVTNGPGRTSLTTLNIPWCEHRGQCCMQLSVWEQPSALTAARALVVCEHHDVKGEVEGGLSDKPQFVRGLHVCGSGTA